MKKLLGCFLCVMLLFCLATPAAANTLVPSVEGTGAYWDGAATNPDFLDNSGDATQRLWLEVGLLGGPAGDLLDTFNWDDGPKVLNEWDPGIVDWDYAIVKIGKGQAIDGAWYAYLNDYSTPNLLDVPPGPPIIEFPNGVSHVSIFGGHSVPEPATMFLLGTGLLGLALFGRKKITK
ncbi:MAG: PEP-CTERM sorting domain-containing protein [Deltaproteobacteria bacterium]|nr:PEP-CTERM sorting domain-containing protein [Deltaproteobacteria bacterium]